MRDEPPRFGITPHRNRRSRSQLVSELDSIKGIGEKTAILLLTHFKSVKRIRQASLTELAKVVGQSKARIVKAGLDPSGDMDSNDSCSDK